MAPPNVFVGDLQPSVPHNRVILFVGVGRSVSMYLQVGPIPNMFAAAVKDIVPLAHPTQPMKSPYYAMDQPMAWLVFCERWEGKLKLSTGL